jgi:hypothetical protein
MAIIRRVDTLTCVVALGSALLAGACSSKSDSASPNGGSGGSGGSNTIGSAGIDSTGNGGDDSVDNSDDAGAAGSLETAPPSTAGCPKSALSVLFSPMYSAYDGVHTFQVPAVVNGLDPTQVDITWSASDPSMVEFAPDPTTGGVMITMQKAGQVVITASAGTLCGTSLLTISAATPQDWEDGSARYNDGVVINRLPRPTNGMGGGSATGGGGTGGAGSAEAACTNCHGDTASGPFKTVQHTPEQTGGFSDADLINIFENGIVPAGGYFDATIVSYAQWQTFHKWDVGDTPQSIVVYLRSLTPAAQTGVANFGGRFGGGGGAGGAGARGGRGGGGASGSGTGGSATGGSGTGGGGTGGS